MRKVISSLAVILILAVCGHAADTDIHFGCGTQEVGINIYTDGERVYFRLENPAGFSNFPIFSGTLTPRTMNMIEASLLDLKVFDVDVVVASWEKTQCKTGKNFLLQCRGAGKIEQPADSGLRTFGISTSLEHQENMDVSADVVRINWGVDTAETDYRHHYISFPFTQDRCWSR
ncbi:MAG: hypothetical protein AAB036_10830 [Elusimicrobiota bacterium]